MGDAPGPPRKTKRACHRCRQARTACDDQRPCARCLRLRRECTDSPPPSDLTLDDGKPEREEATGPSPSAELSGPDIDPRTLFSDPSVLSAEPFATPPGCTNPVVEARERIAALGELCRRILERQQSSTT
eukprot:TRINITY_DN17982_c0_g2_i1.p3 TRINITY_DN17982_c0_g2~~TRINITY_DN17982_c0_g2_i1.p3  ORF type:complete len:130 (-),score=1.18 TRINITY_DN17982_c0_g2_i1:38-427(-)